MKLKVNTFASLREHFGSDYVELDVEEGTTVGDLKQTISKDHPELAPIIARSAVSVDLQYANDSTVLSEANDIALIPPVSGG